MSLPGTREEPTGAGGEGTATKQEEDAVEASGDNNKNSEDKAQDKPDAKKEGGEEEGVNTKDSEETRAQQDGEADTATGDGQQAEEGEEEVAAADAADDGKAMEEGQDALQVDLSRMKTLYQFRSRPTLPYLLTEYGMEDKGAPPIKSKEKKKKKRRTFGDDSGRDKEKEKQMEERQLQILDDMKKLRDYYYDEYTTMLQNRVEQQRHDIRQHDKKRQDRLSRLEEQARQDSHRLKQRYERHTLVTDDTFHQELPKSDLFYITQLQDRLVREGTLRSQTDFDIFWERIQQPDIFYMYFKVPKSDDPTIRDDFNENASSRGAGSLRQGSSSTQGRGSDQQQQQQQGVTLQVGRGSEGPRALSRIAESRESSRPGTRIGHSQHWAITQQFPSQQPREKRRSSFTGLKQPAVHTKSSYMQELEKRFPKLEMPKLHCFSMTLGPKAPDPEEVRHQRNLHSLEKNRKKYTYKLNKMHQLAMANAAAASRILEMHEDIDFIINGAPLSDLISDQYFYSGLPRPASPLNLQTGEVGAPVSSSSPLPDRDQQRILPSLLEEREGSSVPSCRTPPSGKGKGSRKSSASKPASVEPAKPPVIPLSLTEVKDNTRVVNAKCLSTLWTNYMKDVPTA